MGKLSILLDDLGNHVVNVLGRFLEGRAIRGQATVPMAYMHTRRNSARFSLQREQPLTGAQRLIRKLVDIGLFFVWHPKQYTREWLINR